MTDHFDNVSSLPAPAVRLAARAHKAMEDYAMGKQQAIQAAIEYGRALLEGRKLFSSTQAFGQWVTENGLDDRKPWNDPKERSYAMKIAELVDLGTVPKSTFDECPNTLPSNIMKWYRKMHGEASEGQQARARRARATPKTDAAYEAYSEAMEEGTFTNRTDFAKKVGVSNAVMDTVMDRWQREHGNDEARRKAEDEAIERDLSDKSKMTLEKAKEIWKERLHKEEEIRIRAEVRRRIAEAADAMREENARLRKENLFHERNRAKGAPLTATEFRTVQKALDPTPFQERFPDKDLIDRHTEAMKIMNDKKAILVKPGSK